VLNKRWRKGTVYVIMKYLYVILVVLFLVCLFPMPYGYYSIVRIVAMLSFAYLAFKKYQSGQEGLAVVFIGLAILFQPIVKIPLGRTLWNIIDVIVAIGLIVLFLKENKSE